jgi:hypothetical protein
MAHVCNMREGRTKKSRIHRNQLRHSQNLRSLILAKEIYCITSDFSYDPVRLWCVNCRSLAIARADSGLEGVCGVY